MDVSIIIINYNTYDLTVKCIESVLKHTHGIDFEIILVDNASTECNPDVFKQLFPGIILVKSIENLGFSKGNNLGVGIAKGKYILLLNSDTELTNNSIQKVYSHFISNHQLGAVTIQLKYPDGRIQPAAKPFFSLERHFLDSTRLCYLFKSRFKKMNIKYDYNTSFECDWIWGTFFYFPKKNLRYMGGKLTETFFMYCEDMEWCHIFKTSGLKNYHFAEASLIHHIGKSSNPVKRQALLNKSHLTFVRKYHGFGPSLLEYLLLQIDKLYFLYLKVFKRQ